MLEASTDNGGGGGVGGLKRRRSDSAAVGEGGEDENEGFGAGGVADGDSNAVPMGSGVVTLSGLPRSRWESLFNLELVRERNKPVEPPKPPPRAPFFLPTLRGERGVTPTFQADAAAVATSDSTAAGADSATAGAQPAVDGEAALAGWGDAWSDDDLADDPVAKDTDLVATGGDNDGGGGGGGGGGDWMEVESGAQRVAGTGSRLLQNAGAMKLPRGPLGDLLERSHSSVDDPDHHAAIGDLLKSLSPAALDVEVSSLCRGTLDEDGLALLSCLLKWFQRALTTRKDFEIVQAHMHRFLKVHNDVIAQNVALAEQAKTLAAAQAEASRHVRELIQQNICLIKFFCNTQPV